MRSTCTNVHGKEVVHCLRVESLCIEVSKRGGDSLKALCGLFHGGLFVQKNRNGLDAIVDLEVSSEIAECGFDLIVQFMRDGVSARCSPHLDLGRLQFKVD